MKIAVYGTLRKSNSNHFYLQEEEYLGTEKVLIPFKMVSLGHFPGLILSKENHTIEIEVYEISDHANKLIERLECYPNFYGKVKIDTSFGKADTYVLSSKYNHYQTIESGNWNEYESKNMLV